MNGLTEGWRRLGSRFHRMSKKSLPENGALAAQLKAAAELLEAVAADRTLLAGLAKEERVRLMQAAGEVFCPDVAERRRLTRATQRQRKAQKQALDQGVLHETGIRELRRKPVYTTPNALPPASDRQKEMADPDFREVVEPQNCYICLSSTLGS